MELGRIPVMWQRMLLMARGNACCRPKLKDPTCPLGGSSAQSALTSCPLSWTFTVLLLLA